MMDDNYQNSGGPLNGIRVIELGQLLAGPFCGQLLADYGAEVIKVEQPGVGDPMRVWGREKGHGKSLWWPVVARGKKSVTLNLREPEGQQVIRKLVAKSDIILENFRPGTMERWGLGYDELKNNSLLGIGPQNLELRMSNYLNKNDISIIKPRDHLHNDFLDISVKFGIPALLLLLFVYLNMLKSYQPQCKFLGFIVMIMLFCSQLTQSQFAHNQAITFFIVLLYLVMNLKIDNSVNRVTNK